MEIYDQPEPDVLQMAQRAHLFFDKKNRAKLTPNSRGKVREPASKKLASVLKCKDEKFLDFLNKCFVWNPLERMTPLEALQHPWILEGLPEKVLKHHRKMFGSDDNKRELEKATKAKIQGFPKDEKEKTIHEIVKEIKDQEEARLEQKAVEAEQKEKKYGNQHLEPPVPPKKNDCLSQLSAASGLQASPNKERKTRKQR